ncbi:hypothetical protein [Candidatus Uabimicrobium sp. HlEnr_7]|uniref:hypothetical protein n=1 Tax=Candidatus Uabimicrobium helgolandensis TaxID=3095367 RepID=UPI003557BCFE
MNIEKAILIIRSITMVLLVLCCTCFATLLALNISHTYTLKKINVDKEVEKQLQNLSKNDNIFIYSKNKLAYLLNSNQHNLVEVFSNIAVENNLIPQQINTAIILYCQQHDLPYTLPKIFSKNEQDKLWIDAGQQIFVLFLQEKALYRKYSTKEIVKEVNSDISYFKLLMLYDILVFILLIFSSFCLIRQFKSDNPRYSLAALITIAIAMSLPVLYTTLLELFVIAVVLVFVIQTYIYYIREDTLHYSGAIVLFALGILLLIVRAQADDDMWIIPGLLCTIALGWMKLSLKIFKKAGQENLPKFGITFSNTAKAIAWLSIVACLSFLAYVFYSYATLPPLKKLNPGAIEQQIDKKIEDLDKISQHSILVRAWTFSYQKIDEIGYVFFEEEDHEAFDKKEVPPSVILKITQYFPNEDLTIEKQLVHYKDYSWWISTKDFKVILKHGASGGVLEHVKSKLQRITQINNKIDESYAIIKTSMITLTISFVLNIICMLLITMNKIPTTASIFSLLFILTISPFVFLILSLFDYTYERQVIAFFIDACIPLLVINPILLILQLFSKYKEKIKSMWTI